MGGVAKNDKQNLLIAEIWVNKFKPHYLKWGCISEKVLL